MGTQSTARREGRRRAVARRERRIAALAARQHGVLARRQLLEIGLSVRTIRRRVEAGRLQPLHRGVYAFGAEPVGHRGEWSAAVLACGEGALLSHRSAATLWGLTRHFGEPVEITSAALGRGREGILVHEGAIAKEDRSSVAEIPVTTVARTLFDLAEVVDADRLRRACEEADRLRLLDISDLEAVCARCPGRHALRPVRRLIDLHRAPEDTQSPLEDRVLELCRAHGLPQPVVGATVLGREVDALWPSRKLIVEADGWGFHRHRDAFERDRARDAKMQAAGYRVIRLTHRRLESEADAIGDELRRLLCPTPEDGRAAS